MSNSLKYPISTCLPVDYQCDFDWWWWASVCFFPIFFFSLMPDCELTTDRQHRKLCLGPDGISWHTRVATATGGPWVLLWLTSRLRSTFPVCGNTQRCTENIRSADAGSHLPGKIASSLHGPVPTRPPTSWNLSAPSTCRQEMASQVEAEHHQRSRHITVLTVALVLRTDSEYCCARCHIQVIS